MLALLLKAIKCLDARWSGQTATKNDWQHRSFHLKLLMQLNEIYLELVVMYWFRIVALGIVTLVISSLFLLTFAILAFISPSHFQTQRVQVFVILAILVAVSGISIILAGSAKKEKQE